MVSQVPCTQGVRERMEVMLKGLGLVCTALCTIFVIMQMCAVGTVVTT